MLEQSKWTDKVYTGDSEKNSAAMAFYARQREMTTMNDRYKGRQNSVEPTVPERLFRTKYKEEMLARTFKDTSLEDTVSVIKVKDARKAIRRRYASRTNLD